NETIDDVTLGILIRDRFGQDIFGTNTYHLNVPINLRAGEECRVRYIMDEFNLGPGKYTLSPSAHRDDTHVGECYQWVDVIRSFDVVASKDFHFIGFSRLKPRVQVDSV
ncbi:MAG: Wzt carbohydrate-binding domain-containing protein, partial [Desulfobacteraceae bacterium]|nr:Wzt carbohydrate-binding domain-containing protein [Desulfobacteraceae bacterium]